MAGKWREYGSLGDCCSIKQRAERTHSVDGLVVSLQPAGAVEAEERRAVPGLVRRVLPQVELPNFGRVLRARHGELNTVVAQLFNMCGI